ncbi:MAG: outer membrane beta-barrel protein [Mastigocoleus sp.]
MSKIFKSLVTISALSAVFVAPFLLSAQEAFAGPKKGTNASYVGVGVSAGTTNGGQKGTSATFGGNVTGRLNINGTPLSARTQILFSDDTTAIVPQVSLDAGIAKNTNAYVGVGYSFVEKNGQPTPLGNKDSVAVTAGVESEFAKNLMVYGSTTLAPDGFKDTSASPVNISGGSGYRFK